MQDAAKQLSQAFRKMVIMHRRVLDKAALTTGVYRGQHRMLMEIFHHPGRSQKELADLMDMSPAAVAVRLKTLEKDGYIQRIVDPNDNRFHQIELTQLGEKVAHQSVRLFHTIDGHMFDGCTEEEVKVLLSCFEKIHQNLQEMEKSTGIGKEEME
ncbi:MAG: MarR family winged helix-turn-helix transcriptional regulator [Massiliimalia sp.]|jgi:MarR family multiple gene transcriptional regulator MgrA